jgi:opacity protein-like surface antigen
MKKLIFTIVWIACTCGMLKAQVYTNKPVGEKSEGLVDSLKSTPYPYALPIWGDKATALGFDLPYSAGLSVNYLTQESELVINNIMVGFNGGPQFNIDEIIRIDEAIANASAINVRPDIWVFPFLNVYGILGKVSSSTKIGAGIFLPDTANVWNEVASFGTTANFDGTVMGFGITPTMGVGGGWIALDMNFAWTDIDALDKPVKTFVFGPRFGKTFKFKRPQHQIALWVGGFRVQFSSETSGSLPLIDLFPGADIQGKVDGAIMNVEDKQMNVDEWWNSLTPIEQANPVNKAKYETANRVLNTAGELLNGIDGALNDGQTATVDYSLDKSLKDAWNFIIGTQYQLNKKWMIRAEYGFLGSRTQFLTSLQYRFGL